MASSPSEEKHAAHPENPYEDGDLDPAINPDFQEQAEEAGKKDKKTGGQNEDGVGNLKIALIVSGAVVAVIGAICAIAKKMKQANHA